MGRAVMAHCKTSHSLILLANCRRVCAHGVSTLTGAALHAWVRLQT